MSLGEKEMYVGSQFEWRFNDQGCGKLHERGFEISAPLRY